MTTPSPFAAHGPRPMHLYKNLSRWRVMPSEKAVADGYFDRGFSNKAKALFPDELCALCDTGRYYDAFGHIYDTKD
jgi:hypothetical protein